MKELWFNHIVTRDRYNQEDGAGSIEKALAPILHQMQPQMSFESWRTVKIEFRRPTHAFEGGKDLIEIVVTALVPE